MPCMNVYNKYNVLNTQRYENKRKNYFNLNIFFPFSCLDYFCFNIFIEKFFPEDRNRRQIMTTRIRFTTQVEHNKNMKDEC